MGKSLGLVAASTDSLSTWECRLGFEDHLIFQKKPENQAFLRNVLVFKISCRLELPLWHHRTGSISGGFDAGSILAQWVKGSGIAAALA